MIYSPTPMLGWRDGDTYELGYYHVAPLKSLAHLTLEEAKMVAAFMNRLKDHRSIRAVENRVFMARGVSFQKLFTPRNCEDVLKLRIEQGAIVWDTESILERYENVGS